MQYVIKKLTAIDARLSVRGEWGQDMRAMERSGGGGLKTGLGDKEGGAPTTTSAGPAGEERPMNRGGRERFPKFKAKLITRNRDPVLDKGI